MTSMTEKIMQGTRIEAEHRNTYKFIARTVKRTGKVPTFRQVARSIAKDHISERPDYYSRLRKAKL